MKTMIINARVLMHAQRCVKEEAVLIEDGTILDIASECELPHAEQVIDAEGLYLAPGLLDTHTHGIGGFDFNTCTAQAIEESSLWSMRKGSPVFWPVWLWRIMQ